MPRRYSRRRISSRKSRRSNSTKRRRRSRSRSSSNRRRRTRGGRKTSCGTGKIKRKSYRRKSYTRKNGTKVKSSRVSSKCIRDRGRPGKTTKMPTRIQRKGKLGGPGFLSKRRSLQKKLLNRCVKQYGYRSCLGSIMVLERSRSIKNKHGSELKALRNYLKKNYGGKGSFGKRS